MTFSLVALCEQTGQFGMAISSSSPAVAARCANARAGVGAAASQNVTNPGLGPLMLDALSRGLSAPQAVAAAIQAEAYPDYRQLLCIDTQGRTAVWSGDKALGVWGAAEGHCVAAGGNMLADPGVPRTMVRAFETSTGHLGDRLLVAMRAALALGGEAGPVHSAGLLIVGDHPWPLAELRCDWEEGCPIAHISRAWEVYKPQMAAYQTRALDPRAAPSYGVPGDT
ncbi:DUF1028 domain-containing protein [Rhodobacter sp. KR11]|uniref:DUF1028 domain-containing protein n=1 Tax=Rhodobacter sp. KR11 TaxID=2974588 RepID=UPI002221D330|nr:DUF1028 domain-containing protein [Rhodobacter sp. KR11]MCW1918832.1 DUF1028 domain-containing protein [Rhodobacter sp. KR11]